MMELNEFVSKFAELFYDTDISEFSGETEYKNLDEWGSLSAISVIAMVDRDYGVTLKGSDIVNCETIKDLFNKIKDLK